ncbi:PDGLE domain-containing protein [Blastococcus sp. SYSU D00820]
MSARRGTRRLWLVGLLIALLVAGVGSWYASSSPDGLESVAEEHGFADTAEDSAAAGSPLADYTVAGVDGERLSGGLAGVAGVAVTLVLAGGLTLVLRRRSAGRAEAQPATAAD